MFDLIDKNKKIFIIYGDSKSTVCLLKSRTDSNCNTRSNTRN